MEQQFMISTSKLSKEFDRKEVLNQIEITVRQGEIYGILGANETLVEDANIDKLKSTHGNNLEDYLIKKMGGGSIQCFS